MTVILNLEAILNFLAWQHFFQTILLEYAKKITVLMFRSAMITRGIEFERHFRFDGRHFSDVIDVMARNFTVRTTLCVESRTGNY
jgi:hypothetical protein